jgi:predicted short-subunit dehydrogenase-like oxidoreductase (DUF2520 family)
VNLAAVAVIGGGRVGLSFARALHRAGHPVSVLTRREQRLPEPLELASTLWGPILSTVTAALVAVPDDEIPAVAARIANLGVLNQRHVVLHLSGSLGREALAPLEASGAGLGSLHPLQTFADRDGDTPLRGVAAVLEGDNRAISVGRDLAMSVGMLPMAVDTAQKSLYHAAAVFASNYLVTLTAMAEKLAAKAGLTTARGLFLPIMRQTLLNLATNTPGDALTGPIRRGDVGTVRAHLAALQGDERALYAALGRETLKLAAPHLSADVVAELEGLLGA